MRSRASNDLRAVLAPPSGAVTPERLALAAVAAVTTMATPPALAYLDGVHRIAGDAVAPRAAATLVAAAIAVTLARRALLARTSLQARVWLIAGGSAGGALAAILGYAAPRSPPSAP